MDGERGRQTLWTMAAVTAGVATGLWLWRRGSEAGRPTEGQEWSRVRGSAQGVADALRADSKLSRRPIEVDAVAEGVVELTGRVRTRAESERAVKAAQGTTGVYTVVNRLVIEEEETQRESTRRRWSEGAPELRERHHYGMGVGMGTRRQSPDTDPDRPSDKQRILDRELDVGNVEDEPEPEVAPAPGAGPDGASESDSAPGTVGTVDPAILNGDPRPTTEPGDADPIEGEDEGADVDDGEVREEPRE
jgi:hypothetical protein